MCALAWEHWYPLQIKNRKTGSIQTTNQSTRQTVQRKWCSRLVQSSARSKPKQKNWSWDLHKTFPQILRRPLQWFSSKTSPETFPNNVSQSLSSKKARLRVLSVVLFFFVLHRDPPVLSTIPVSDDRPYGNSGQQPLEALALATRSLPFPLSHFRHQ